MIRDYQLCLANGNLYINEYLYDTDEGTYRCSRNFTYGHDTGTCATDFLLIVCGREPRGDWNWSSWATDGTHAGSIECLGTIRQTNGGDDPSTEGYRFPVDGDRFITWRWNCDVPECSLPGDIEHRICSEVRRLVEEDFIVENDWLNVHMNLIEA